MSDRPRPRSLFWPIAGAFLLAALLGTVAQSLVAVAVLRPLEARDQRARAELAVSRFAAAYAALPAPPDSATIVELLRRARAEHEVRAALIYRGTDGGVYGDRPERARGMLQTLERGAPVPPPPERDRSPREARPRLQVLASHPVQDPSGARGEVLALRLSREGGFARRNADALLLSLPIALVASLVAALVMVRLLVRRLRRLERFAQRLAAEDLTARVEDTRGDEIGRLAAGFDRMAERLAAARGRLEREELQRRHLFADITHELATPLTSIRGYTETLLDPAVPVSEAERQRYLGNMLEESRRLDRLIRDLFDLARLEAGASPLETEPLDWLALARNVTRRFEPRFAAAGLRLEWGAAPSEAWIVADGHRIEQVVENLLVNALRYVPAEGAVRLSMSPTPLGDGRGGYRLTVEDDGPGAPPEELPRLFERFYRARGTRAGVSGHDAEGSGLGLAIVREIVLRHGGGVRARARVPHGLAIEIDLPAADAPREPERPGGG